MLRDVRCAMGQHTDRIEATAVRAMAEWKRCIVKKTDTTNKNERPAGDARARRSEDPPEFGAIASIPGGEEFVTLATRSNASGAHIEELLKFEGEHRGTHVGLMALRLIFRYARRTGLPSDLLRNGKRQALQRLIAYVHLPECAESIGHLSSGGYREPFVEQCLRDIATKNTSRPIVRVSSQYHLAAWLLSRRDFVERRASILAQIEQLKASKTPKALGLAKVLQLELAATPDTRTFARWEKDGREILRSLKAKGHQLHKPEVKNLDSHYHIVQIDAEKTNVAPLYSELASALLLKDTRLQKGAMAPNFNVSLVNGEEWNLREQRGRVVVIQFSFTGCFPCKKLYPTLAGLVREHGDSVSMLTIMRDSDLATTEAAVSSDKLTWNVCWDEKANVTTQWAVRSFPTVCVLDQDGRVASNRASRKSLASTVGNLLR